MAINTKFASAIVDFGLIVKDLKASVEFYTEAIGFIEVMGFDVPADIAGRSGLTDHRPLEISILQINPDSGIPSTDLKLMQIDDVETDQNDRAFVHSRYGVNYMSLFVSDVTSTLARLREKSVPIRGEGIVQLPLELSIGALLRPPPSSGEDAWMHDFEKLEDVGMIVVQDPDGNFIEMIGPFESGKPDV